MRPRSCGSRSAGSSRPRRTSRRCATPPTCSVGRTRCAPARSTSSRSRLSRTGGTRSTKVAPPISWTPRGWRLHRGRRRRRRPRDVPAGSRPCPPGHRYRERVRRHRRHGRDRAGARRRRSADGRGRGVRPGRRTAGRRRAAGAGRRRREVRTNDTLAAVVSTVDDLDLVQGRVAAVLALQEIGDGVVGHYGYGDGASSNRLPAPPDDNAG